MRGYKIENGQIVVDPSAADVVRRIFTNCISGMGIKQSGKSAGLAVTHSSATMSLSDILSKIRLQVTKSLALIAALYYNHINILKVEAII